MKKIFVVILLVLVTTLSFAKNIFVVYDDSKSMNKDNRSVYANYAMQTLISLLEEDDNLTITKMSDVDNKFRNKLVIDLKKIPEEIKYFREKINPSSNVTPYESVESILDYINKLDISDENNWLIIISDGYFEDGEEIPNIDTIEEKIKSTIKNKKIKPIFLLIGSNEEELNTYEAQKGIDIWKQIFGTGEYPKIYKSVGKKDIVDKMNEIAQLLTNKSAPTEKNYEIVGNKIVFSPLFPLNKVILLDQGNNPENKIGKILVDDKEIKNIKVYSPQKNTKNLNLTGHTIHIDGTDNLLNKGQLVIEFENKVPENIHLYPEVAGKFNVVLFNENNEEIKERFTFIEEGKKVKITGKLENIIDGKPLKYIDGTMVLINYGGEKINLEYNPETNRYETEITILKDRKSIDAIAEYKGYFYYQSDIYVIEGTPKPVIIEEVVEPIVEEIIEPIVEEVIEIPKIYSLDIEKNINTEKLSQEEFKNLKIRIIPRLNDELLDKKDFDDFKINFDSKLDGKIKSENNTWVFIPEIKEVWYGFLKPQGNFILKIKAEKENINLEKEIVIDIEKLSFSEQYLKAILHVIGAFFTLILLYGYYSKKRFNKKARILKKEYTDEISKPDISRELKASIGNKITPFKDYEMIIDGIKFIANGNSLRLYGENLGKAISMARVKKLYVNGDIITKEDLAEKHIYTLFVGNSIKIVYDDDLIKEYIYQKY